MRELFRLREGVSRQFTTFDQTGGEKTLSVYPGEKKVFADSNECGIISRIWFTFPGWFWQHWRVHAPIDTTILKKLILRIYWDGNDYPSVEAPMGDFFGVGHCEYRHYLSKYLGMSSGGFYSYFPMPFDKGVRIEIENLHESMRADVFMNVNYQRFDRLPEGATRFHCLFNCGYNPGIEPLEVMEAQGEGHFVGCCLSIQGERLNYLAYLEAPEYIYVDTEDGQGPSIVGTGLEDYFNGGWYFRDGEFHGPLHGVPLKDTLRSMVSMYRFHDEDAISFKKSLRMAFINPRTQDQLSGFKFSSTAYWYQTKAQRLAYALPAADRLADVYRVRDVDHQPIP